MTEAEIPKIQLLYFEGCPLAAGARSVLNKALSQCGLEKHEEIDILGRNVRDKLRSWGSPTILIDGVDATGERKRDSVACRVYPTADGQPDLDTVVACIRAAQIRRSI